MLRYTFLLLFSLSAVTDNLSANESPTPAKDSPLTVTDSDVILSNDDIKKVYGDYFREQFANIDGLKKAQLDDLAAKTDIIICEKMLNSSNRNNTLQKFEFFKKFYSRRIIVNGTFNDSDSSKKYQAWAELQLCSIENGLDALARLAMLSTEKSLRLSNELNKAGTAFLEKKMTDAKQKNKNIDVLQLKNEIEKEKEMCYASLVMLPESIFDECMDWDFLKPIENGDFSKIPSSEMHSFAQVFMYTWNIKFKKIQEDELIKKMGFESKKEIMARKEKLYQLHRRYNEININENKGE